VAHFGPQVRRRVEIVRHAAVPIGWLEQCILTVQSGTQLHQFFEHALKTIF
jgi:hypothetical protein